jgi:hypothetical protein
VRRVRRLQMVQFERDLICKRKRKAVDGIRQKLKYSIILYFKPFKQESRLLLDLVHLFLCYLY